MGKHSIIVKREVSINMNKTLIIIILIFLVIMGTLAGLILANNARANEIRRHNRQYEQYVGTEIWGTELATLINRAVDQNRRNDVELDEYNHFIDNGTNSIKIEIEMITIEETFSMERIYHGGMSEFMRGFNFITFKATQIEYHEQTGKVSRMMFIQLED